MVHTYIDLIEGTRRLSKTMFFSRWTFYQIITLLFLGGVPFLAEIFNQSISVPVGVSAVNTMGPMLMTILFLALILGGFNLFLFLQSRKSTTFLSHPAWEKMHVLLILIGGISLIIFISAFFMSPLNEVLENTRWGVYLILYYFFFIFNLIVLSLIHKVKKDSIANERKVRFLFIVSLLILIFTIYII